MPAVYVQIDHKPQVYFKNTEMWNNVCLRN